MRKLTEVERELQRKMINSSSAWPLLPILPMKQYQENGRWPNLGMLIHGQGLTIYLAGLDATMKPGITTQHIIDTIPSQEFSSLDELLDAGWVVD